MGAYLAVCLKFKFISIQNKYNNALALNLVEPTLFFIGWFLITLNNIGTFYKILQMTDDSSRRTINYKICILINF